MSGFAGFANFKYRRENTELVIKHMIDEIKDRGTDIEAYYDDLYTHIGYKSRSVPNMESKKKSMNFKEGDNEYIIVFDGEVQNRTEIIKEEKLEMNTVEDEELILRLYSKYGEKFIEKIKGFYAFVIWNKENKELFMARDNYGMKPIFYATYEDNFIFASEIKSILKFPGIKSCITYYGICNMILKGILPIKTKIFFKDVIELTPGEYLVFKPNEIIKGKCSCQKIDIISAPVIRTTEEKIVLNEENIKNIVKIKDLPDRILEDAMLIKSCEKIKNDFSMDELKQNEVVWNSEYEIRKELLSQKLKINLDEYYFFQKNRNNKMYDFTNIDRIANRFGYNIILPQINFVIDEKSIIDVFEKIINDIDSPIWNIIDRDKTIKFQKHIDMDTISYLIEIDMWLKEYNICIV